MIMDDLLEFVDGSVVGNTGTNLLGDQIDTVVAAKDLGVGEPFYWVIVITTSVVGTSSTVNFRLRSDDTASIHATSSTPHAETGVLSEAKMVAGSKFCIALPRYQTYERYLGVQAVVAEANLSAGAANIFLTKDPPGWYAYPQADH